MDRPNPLEALFATLFALAAQLVRGILLAPVIALRRALSRVRVGQVHVDVVIPLRHDVLRPGRPIEDAHWDGDRDPDARHWAAGWGGEVVGVATVLARPFPAGEGPAWQLRGMATATDVRGRGIGAKLLAAVVHDVAAPMWCNARTSAQGFYARHGWTVRGEPFDVPGVGPHVRMTREGP